MSYPRTNQKTFTDTDTNAQSVTTHSKIGPAENARRWRLRRVLASYRTATQTGTITIAGVAGGPGGTDPQTLTFSFTGQTHLDFGTEGLQCAPYTDLVVTLSAGGASVVSDLATTAFAE